MWNDGRNLTKEGIYIHFQACEIGHGILMVYWIRVCVSGHIKEGQEKTSLRFSCTLVEIWTAYLSNKIQILSWSYFTTNGQSISQCVLVSNPLWDMWPDITSCRKVAMWKSRCCLCGASSLRRGRVCSCAMQPVNGPSRAESVTILYCLIWDSPNLEEQIPIVISPMNKVSQLYPLALGSIYFTC
jgi:hypothetical protein